MIIINDKPGQLCNRLWAYSFFIAYAQKHNRKIYIPHFREYRSYFNDLSVIPDVYFHNIEKWPHLDVLSFHFYVFLTKVLRVISMFVNLARLRIYIDSKNWTRERWPEAVMRQNKTILFFGSWLHPKEVSALLEAKHHIVRLFEPKHLYRERVDQLFTDVRGHCDVLVGVHIRRTDYKNFHSGVYYYNDDIYKRYMTIILKLFRDRRVCFYIASDSPINSSQYHEYDVVHLRNSEMIEDLYALSRCDYIMGPPSTFSMWASFVGDVPLRILRYKDEKITLGQFSPILYQNVFRNGEQFHHIDNRDETSLHEKSLEGYL
jgi:hypothetical protein